MYNELIDALRYCADGNNDCEGACPFYDKQPSCSMYDTMIDAADAIERLQTENNELRAENETYHKLVLLSAGEIGELRYKLHLDNMEIDTVPSIEDLKVPSGKEKGEE